MSPPSSLPPRGTTDHLIPTRHSTTWLMTTNQTAPVAVLELPLLCCVKCVLWCQYSTFGHLLSKIFIELRLHLATFFLSVLKWSGFTSEPSRCVTHLEMQSPTHLSHCPPRAPRHEHVTETTHGVQSRWWSLAVVIPYTMKSDHITKKHLLPVPVHCVVWKRIVSRERVCQNRQSTSKKKKKPGYLALKTVSGSVLPPQLRTRMVPTEAV